jgi:hypothetical protein
MNDRELDAALLAADPYDADLVGEPADERRALLVEVLAQPRVDRHAVLLRRRMRRSRRAVALRTRIAVSVGTAAAITAVIAVPALLVDGGTGSDPAGSVAGSGHQPRPGVTTTTPIRYAAAAVRVARANPRVLVTAPGWTVRSLEGFSPDAGEMTFQLGPDRWHDESFAGGTSHLNAAPQFEVTWYPRDQYESYLADRAAEPGLQHLEVLGNRAQMISYSATDHAVLLAPQGKVFLELRGTVGDETAFKRFLDDSIEQVDVPTWLAAMPATVVTPDTQASAARKVLADIPLPPGMTAADLDRGVALDSYQFGARVTGMVTCGWVAEWQRARRSGDGMAADRAVAALASSHHWTVLQDMNAEGDYPEEVWGIADEVAAGHLPEGYRAGLGCSS